MTLLGAVPYLNSIPLLRGLSFDVRKEPPAVLDRLLRIGELDIATAPVTSLFDNPDWSVLPGMAIGTRKAARSVLLGTRSPELTIEKVRSIYLDIESRTAAPLIKVLLALKYGRDLGDITFVTPIPTPTVDAKLIIGDKALREERAPHWSGPIYDLGAEWTSWTQRPFVFAAWVSRESRVDPDLVAELQSRVEQNLASLEDWLPDITGYDEGYEQARLRTYFRDNMNYRFGPEEQEGLLLFHRQSREIGLLEKPFDLSFVNA